jgi:hypothetical protein
MVLKGGMSALLGCMCLCASSLFFNIKRTKHNIEEKKGQDGTVAYCAFMIDGFMGRIVMQ